MDRTLTLLGIESSCDDTAAAVVRERVGGRPEILSSEVAGQTALHEAFGGVVPEIAARAHAERLDGVVEAALQRAGIGLDDLDAVAVTAGPGLIGGVLSGVMLARGLAAARALPLVAVNHLAGHALTPRLTDGIDFPYLMLLVSGVWVERSTMLRVKPLTRQPNFWACRSPADRRSRLRLCGAIRCGSGFQDRFWIARGAICPSRV